MAGLLGAGCHDVPGWSGMLCGWGSVVSGLGYNGSWGISDWCAAGRGPPGGGVPSPPAVNYSATRVVSGIYHVYE